MTTRVSAEDYRRLITTAAKPKQSKYRNKRVVIIFKGKEITVDSQKEASHIKRLELREKAGQIFDLELQPKYPLIVNGVKVATYIADARFNTITGAVVIQDVKSEITRKNPTYRLKNKLFHACHPGLTIEEV